MPQPLAGGGRYDRLMSMLGSAKPVPAVGFTMRLDMIAHGDGAVNGSLVLALPSKGRLQEQAEALLARAGLAVEKRGGRNYRGRLAGYDDVEVAFLSAAEIARELGDGPSISA